MEPIITMELIHLNVIKILLKMNTIIIMNVINILAMARNKGEILNCIFSFFNSYHEYNIITLLNDNSIFIFF